MFFIRQDREHIEFLRRLAAKLDEALKPAPPVDYNAEFAKQLAARTTSLTVSFGACTCDPSA
jgi:hypothetical protein